MVPLPAMVPGASSGLDARWNLGSAPIASLEWEVQDDLNSPKLAVWSRQA